jgi:GT2 family glycosyltransferase
MEEIMNPVLILTRNNLELTKRCVESVRAQDIPTELFIYDNGSTDGTHEWIVNNRDLLGFRDSINCINTGVTYAWNVMLKYNFEDEGRTSVLVLNNDAIIPPWFMRELASYGLLYELDPFVTGVATNDMSVIAEKAGVCPPSPHPDFSAFLIGRSVWERVGPFDERFVLYCQDCDYHVRAHRAGVHLWKANVPYFHINSQTLHRSTPVDRMAIQEQANRDRAMFKSIYGVLPGTAEYNELFK